MARPKSPEKRTAILQAAVYEIAQSGVGASTANIARRADMAEGSLFRYFATKDELLNETYVALKAEVYRRICVGFPNETGLRERARHVWTKYLQWAIEKPEERKASLQLNVSDVITTETRARVTRDREFVARAMSELDDRGVFKGLPRGFATTAMSALQEAVMEAVMKKPRQKARLIKAGFEAFWRMAKEDKDK